MRTLSVKTIQHILQIFVFFVCIAVSPSVHAGQADRLSGWAWSENIGWISFNCTNTNSCETVDYGVTIFGVGATQAMSGWAWAPNIGWIDFSQANMLAVDRSFSGVALVYNTVQEPYCNTTDPYQTNASGITGVSAGLFDCSNTSAEDGWDGVISLNSSTGITYKPVADTTDNTADGWNWEDNRYYLMDGYAWGSDVVGWISFSCQTTSSCGTVGYGVYMDPFFFDFSADLGIPPAAAVSFGGSFNHTWVLIPDVDITSCVASNGPGTWSDTTSKATSPSPLSSLVANATSSATSTLACTNVDGKTLVRDAFIRVLNPPPTVDFNALDYNIPYSSPADLIWSTEHVSDCTASAGDAGWSGAVATGTNITYTSSNLTTDTTFNITCNSPTPADYAPVLQTLEISVQKLVVNFFVEDGNGDPVDPTELLAYTDKDNLDLVWETEFATLGCVASGDWTGTKVPVNAANDVVDGSEIAPIPDSGVFNYTLTCQGVLGQEIIRTISIRVTKNPGFSEEIGGSGQ